MAEKKRYSFSVSDHPLPLYIDSIGFNPNELDFDRPEGYPYYHWLQTVEGEGYFNLAGEEFILKPGYGVFVTPYMPHSYYSDPEAETLWATYYVTFSGAAVDQILTSLDMNYSAVYEETGSISFSQLIEEMLVRIEKEPQYLAYESSVQLYQFLMMLKKHGKLNNKRSVLQSYEKIRPIVEWLETVYHEDIGLVEMAEKAEVSSQYLNKLFHETFGISPYSFLVQLRIREAKRILLSEKALPLKDVAGIVGFNGVSHFVSTFKKREGITPSSYRSLHR
ncbi:AraC family transcriptional regulator [Halalkalibacter hemicellulosilyticus]|uniref:Transcriptional regulator n=1 Tax=Halalkalibacter hemicellulosilyticusJCM 9152 TaxID=1236971 RepID=W4QLH0_9BACI|nr:AraC family transcriptional regulator [Halalkalibacter hemicellulosilyticus]GAE32921.1 transcriptional regulator [Halalkalibacter hemicellulosilyticusJCM 9152]